jgi:hypothetical protein
MHGGWNYVSPWVVMGFVQIAIWTLVIGGILVLRNHR